MVVSARPHICVTIFAKISIHWIKSPPIKCKLGNIVDSILTTNYWITAIKKNLNYYFNLPFEKKNPRKNSFWITIYTNRSNSTKKLKRWLKHSKHPHKRLEKKSTQPMNVCSVASNKAIKWIHHLHMNTFVSLSSAWDIFNNTERVYCSPNPVHCVYLFLSLCWNLPLLIIFGIFLWFQYNKVHKADYFDDMIKKTEILFCQKTLLQFD